MYPSKSKLLDLRDKVRTPASKTKQILMELQKLGSSSSLRYSVTSCLPANESEYWRSPNRSKLNLTLPPKKLLNTPSRLQEYSLQTKRETSKPYWRCPKPDTSSSSPVFDRKPTELAGAIKSVGGKSSNVITINDDDLQYNEELSQDSVQALGNVPAPGFLTADLPLPKEFKSIGVSTDDDIVGTKANRPGLFDFSPPVVRGPQKRLASPASSANALSPASVAVSTPATFGVSTPASVAVSTPATFGVSTPASVAVSTPATFGVSTPASVAVSTPATFGVSTLASVAVSTPPVFAVSTPVSFAVAVQTSTPNTAMTTSGKTLTFGTGVATKRPMPSFDGPSSDSAPKMFAFGAGASSTPAVGNGVAKPSALIFGSNAVNAGASKFNGFSTASTTTSTITTTTSTLLFGCVSATTAATTTTTTAAVTTTTTAAPLLFSGFSATKSAAPTLQFGASATPSTEVEANPPTQTATGQTASFLFGSGAQPAKASIFSANGLSTTSTTTATTTTTTAAPLLFSGFSATKSSAPTLQFDGAAALNQPNQATTGQPASFVFGSGALSTKAPTFPSNGLSAASITTTATTTTTAAPLLFSGFSAMKSPTLQFGASATPSTGAESKPAAQTASFMFGGGAQPAKATIFSSNGTGTMTSTASVPALFAFGAAASSTAAPAFGSKAPTTVAAAPPFAFNQPSTTSAPPLSFGFGSAAPSIGSATQPFSFGASQPSSNDAAPAFGSGLSASQTPFNFNGMSATPSMGNGGGVASSTNMFAPEPSRAAGRKLLTARRQRQRK